MLKEERLKCKEKVEVLKEDLNKANFDECIFEGFIETSFDEYFENMTILELKCSLRKAYNFISDVNFVLNIREED